MHGGGKRTHRVHSENRPPRQSTGLRHRTAAAGGQSQPPTSCSSIGLHLEQYRHATRLPEIYWREALRRDRGRCALQSRARPLASAPRANSTAAETHLRASIARLTSRNPNPYDGEAHYQLGLCLRAAGFRGPRYRSGTHRTVSDAYDAFYKATWNQAWQPAGFHALAEIDALRAAIGRRHSIISNARCGSTPTTFARAISRSSRCASWTGKPKPRRFSAETLALDPLDWWARASARRDFALRHAGAVRSRARLRARRSLCAKRWPSSKPHR